MEKNVEQLAALLEEKPEVVKEALEDETGEKFNGLINQYRDSRKIFTTEELIKKIDNSNQEFIDKIASDGQQIPQKLYNRVKGNAFEKYEKQRAAEYGIEKWENLDDLNNQIIAKKIAESGNTSNDLLEEKETKIKELKNLVLEADKGKEKEIAEVRGIVGREMNNFNISNAINSVDIEAEGELLENQREILDAVFRRDHDFEFREGKTVVLKNGEILKNKVGDPLSVDEVLTDFAPKYVSIKTVPKGGRGGSSTDKTTKGSLKEIFTMAQLEEYAEARDIKLGTAEFLDLMQKVQLENPAFNK